MSAAPEPESNTGPTRSRVLRAFGLWGAGALVALLLLIGQQWLFVRLSWPHRQSPGQPEFGINFSCNHAEYLLLEDPHLGPAGYVSDARPGRVEYCAETLHALLEGLNAKRVRINVEWSQVEPAEGQFDFTLIDALLAECDRSGATALVGVGMKAQRHPEFYLPGWLLRGGAPEHGAVVDADPVIRARALEMVAAVVAHTAGSRAVDSWSADNEPYIPSKRADGWRLSRGYVQAVRDTIHANDPQQRPVIINHAQHFVMDRRWRDALEDGDGLAASFYPFRNVGVLGHAFVVRIPEIGFLAPNYAAQARAARREGKPYYITEMQAEPWTDDDLRLLNAQNPSANLTASNFRKAMDYARRIGADRVYLWGAEWWLYQQQINGDSTWWELGRATIAGE